MASQVVAPWLAIIALRGMALANKAASANASIDEDSDYVCGAAQGEAQCTRKLGTAEAAELALCEEQLRECTAESAREVTKARNRGFQELKKAHEQDIAAELYLLERKHRRETDRLHYDLDRSKRDLFQKDELIRALEHRLSAAEKQIEQHASGTRCQVLGNRASALDDQLRFTQAQLQVKKDSLFELTQQLSAKHQELTEVTSQSEGRTSEAEERALAAEERVRSAEARAALSRRRELRALKRVRGRFTACDHTSSSIAQELNNVSSPDNSIIGLNNKSRADSRPPLWPPTWMAPIEALAQSIRSMVPTHDDEVAGMYDKISGQVSWIAAATEANLISEELVVRASLWIAAFATVATWRCLWVFSFRLIVSDSLALMSSLSSWRRSVGRAEDG